MRGERKGEKERERETKSEEDKLFILKREKDQIIRGEIKK